MSEAIVKPAVVLPENPMAMLGHMVQAGYKADELGKMMDLAERWEQRQSEKAFCAALAEFQRRCPPILKSREVSGGSMRFKYAGYDDIMRVAGPVMAELGITVGFDIEQTETVLKGTCRVRVGSHFEDKHFQVPVTSQLRVSEAQQHGAALSYLKRYLLCAALNIVVTDEDNEQVLGNVTDGQLAEIMKLVAELKSLGVEASTKWIQWAANNDNAVDWKDVPADRFEHVVQQMQAKIKAKKELKR